MAGIGLMIAHCLKHDPPTKVTTVRSAFGDIEKVVLASGTVQAYKQVNVGAQTSGQLKSLKVTLGESVRSGDLIAEIDPLSEQSALLNALAALDAVRAQRRAAMATLRQAQLEFTRQQTMLPEHATPQAAYDTAEATLDANRSSLAVLDAQIAQAQSAVDTAKLNLGYCKINAPMDGDVVAVITQQGQTVIASQIAPIIIKLARLDLITVKAQVSEADVVRVRPGQDVYFTILGEPDHRYSAKLRAVEPAPDSNNSDSPGGGGGPSAAAAGSSNAAIYYNALFDVPNEDKKLRIAMTAQVNIVLGAAKHALLVPAAALSQSGISTATVQVLDAKGRPSARKVSVGINNNVNAEILSGLKVGERVVIGTSDPKAANGDTSQ